MNFVIKPYTQRKPIIGRTIQIETPGVEVVPDSVSVVELGVTALINNKCYF